MTREHSSSHTFKSAVAKEVYFTTSRTRRKISNVTKNAKSVGLFSLLAMLCMITTATAQQECSCAPREYTFRLVFSGICPPPTPPFPPNDYFGSGVKDYTCSVGASPVNTRNRSPPRDPILRRLDSDGGVKVDETELAQLFPELQVSTQSIADQTPVVVSSIQFIQQDRNGTPIESTLRNGDKTDGENVRFISSIVNRPSQIPYRLTMILRGFNEAGQAIQNTFTIEFTNSCGVPTFTSGEAIGWVIFDKLVPASDETCPMQRTPSTSPTSKSPTTYSYFSTGDSDGRNDAKPGKSYASKGSKKSSKATSSYGKSEKSSSKSSKGNSRHIRRRRT